MWVRAQINYLQLLPDDIEKQRALEKLPPDLPQTYVRILETIDGIYPEQTTKYIQRLLIWLVLNKVPEKYSTVYHSRAQLSLSINALCQVICI